MSDAMPSSQHRKLWLAQSINQSIVHCWKRFLLQKQLPLQAHTHCNTAPDLGTHMSAIPPAPTLRSVAEATPMQPFSIGGSATREAASLTARLRSLLPRAASICKNSSTLLGTNAASPKPKGTGTRGFARFAKSVRTLTVMIVVMEGNPMTTAMCASKPCASLSTRSPS